MAPHAPWAYMADYYQCQGASMSRKRESNPRPAVYKTAALPLSYSGWNLSPMNLTAMYVPTNAPQASGTKYQGFSR